jgi:large subunit ribosomal protein L22
VTGPKTNERPGTRAIHRHARVSAYKVREVLDLIRNKPVAEAEEILRFSERDAAILVGKVVHSAVANAANNDELDPDELYVSACFADEGTTIKRWRPRARGRATRIRKRTCHITVIVSRLPADRLARLAARRRADIVAQRARRVAGARRSEVAEGDTRSRAERRRRGGDAVLHDHDHDHDHDDEAAEDVSAAEIAAEAEEEGVVDETAAAVAAAEAGETPVTAADLQEEADIDRTEAGAIAAAEEEAGIVDPQATAVAAGEAEQAAEQAEAAEERGTDEKSE